MRDTSVEPPLSEFDTQPALLHSLRKAGPGSRKVDVRLLENRNSNSHGARPVHLVITMITWIQTSRLSIKKSLSSCIVEGL